MKRSCRKEAALQMREEKSHAAKRDLEKKRGEKTMSVIGQFPSKGKEKKKKLKKKRKNPGISSWGKKGGGGMDSREKGKRVFRGEKRKRLESLNPRTKEGLLGREYPTRIEGQGWRGNQKTRGVRKKKDGVTNERRCRRGLLRRLGFAGGSRIGCSSREILIKRKSRAGGNREREKKNQKLAEHIVLDGRRGVVLGWRVIRMGREGRERNVPARRAVTERGEGSGGGVIQLGGGED